MNFVSTSIYQKAINLALNEGLSPDLFSAGHERTDTVVDLPYVSIEYLWDLYEIVDTHLDPGFSLRHGQQMMADDYGTLGLSWKTSWEAKDLLRRTERYMILVTDYGHISVNENDEITEVKIDRDPRRRGIAISNETTVAMITKVIREVTNVDIYPVSISFKHEHPQDYGLFADYFRCEVKFSQPENLIHWRSRDMETPTVKADKSIHQFLLERMEEEKEGISTNSDKLIIDVNKLIADALPGGIPTVIQISEHLSMSPRTLNRRLAEKGFTFRDLVKATQESISLDLLRNSSRSIGEIAFQTGFSEQSAFNRAFKRWKGLAPLEFRKNLTK